MKKTFIFAAAFAVLALSSCKKERTCTCKYTEDDVDVVETETIKSTKKVAEAVCLSEGYTIVMDGEEVDSDDSDVSCTLD